MLPDERISLGIVQPSSASVPASAVTALPATTASSPESAAISPASDSVIEWTEDKVKPGDTLASIFRRHKLPSATLHQIMQLGEPVSLLEKIQPGQKVMLQKGPDGELLALHYRPDALNHLYVYTTGQGFAADWVMDQPSTNATFARLEITAEANNLYQAGLRAGLDHRTIMELAQIFQWDVSYSLDLRKGDTCLLLYEQKYMYGKKVAGGKILAARFYNRKRSFAAVFYDGRGDYYAPDGRSMRKAFIRDPLDFTRVSSGFNPNRLHPIHKRKMPHRGVDYAAPKGTPVYASGDGKVAIRGETAARGLYLVLQHGETYTTKYLHLSGFAKGIRPGQKVSQGQTIGYVGSTGWATGPHLHYEFLIRGVHKNPLEVSLPKADPIAADEFAKFKARALPILAQLDQQEAVASTALAKAKTKADARSGGGR